MCKIPFFITEKCHQTAHQKMQSDINRLISWCNKNQLTINVKKTKCVLYGSKHVTHKTRLTPIKMNDVELQYTDHYKYLGITVGCNLNYQKYIKEIFKKSAHKIYILSKIINPFFSNMAAAW